MSKYIPPEKRSSEKEIIKEISIISNNSVIDCLIKSVNGLFAVLDENRQIISVNDSMLIRISFMSVVDSITWTSKTIFAHNNYNLGRWTFF